MRTSYKKSAIGLLIWCGAAAAPAAGQACYPVGVRLINQLCSADASDPFAPTWDVLFDGTWGGGTTVNYTETTATCQALGVGVDEEKIHPLVTHQARFGQSVSMGDFDGDGHTDVLISSNWANRTMDLWMGLDPDTDFDPGDTAATRTYAGRVYLIYGPWGGTPTNPWPDRPGFQSKNAYNWASFTDAHSNRDPSVTTPDNYPDSFAWFNAFDLESEPRHNGRNHRCDLFPDDNDNADDRIPGIVFHGSYGRYDSSGAGKTTQTIDPMKRSANGYVPFVGTRRGDYAISHFPYWIEPDTDPATAHPDYDPALDCGDPYTTLSYLDNLNNYDGEYERMGYSARFVGDVNGDGCDDIAIGAHEFDE